MAVQHYVDNSKLLDGLIAHRKEVKAWRKYVARHPRSKKEEPPVSEFLGGCFLAIAQGMSKRPNFADYTFRDEMIGDGTLACLRAIDKFDPSKSSNPFSYFTTVIWRAFTHRIRQEQKQARLREDAQFAVSLFALSEALKERESQVSV